MAQGVEMDDRARVYDRAVLRGGTLGPGLSVGRGHRRHDIPFHLVSQAGDSPAAGNTEEAVLRVAWVGMGGVIRDSRMQIGPF